MLTWLAKRIATRIDLDVLANKVEVKLAERLDERLNSRFRKEALKGALKARLENPSKTVYAITGEKFPFSGPYYLKEDPQYQCTFREGDIAPHHKVGAAKLQVTWIFDPPKES